MRRKRGFSVRNTPQLFFMFSNTSACIFDMDGVIVDSEALWSIATKEFFRKRGIEYHGEHKTHVMGKRLDEESEFYKTLYGFPESPQELSAEHLHIVEEIYRTRGVPAMPGFLEFLGNAKSRFSKIGLASGSPRHIIEYVLGSLKIQDSFSAVVSGDEVVRGKPSPDIYLEAATRLGVSPDECVAVEDSLNGVRAAKAAGMRCIAVPDARWSRKEDFEGLADVIVGRLDEFDLSAL